MPYSEGLVEAVVELADLPVLPSLHAVVAIYAHTAAALPEFWLEEFFDRSQILRVLLVAAK